MDAFDSAAVFVFNLPFRSSRSFFSLSLMIGCGVFHCEINSSLRVPSAGVAFAINDKDADIEALLAVATSSGLLTEVHLPRLLLSFSLSFCSRRRLRIATRIEFERSSFSFGFSFSLSDDDSLLEDELDDDDFFRFLERFFFFLSFFSSLKTRFVKYDANKIKI